MSTHRLKALVMALVALVLATTLLPAQTQAAIKPRLVKKDGWYIYDKGLDIPKKGAYLASNYVERMSSKAVRNGRKRDDKYFFAGYLGARSFKLASKIKYGKFTITWNKALGYSVTKLHPAKKVSAAAFKKAIKKKAVYWVLLRVKNGKVVEARWMPMSSVIMLD